MNKLFILGNGFDLAHKLPTSYEHFIVDFLKQGLHSANDRNNHVHKDELIQIETYQYLFRAQEIDEIKTIEKFHNFINLYKAYIKVKYISSFFERLISLEEGLVFWYDIEKFYYKELTKIVSNGSDFSGRQEVQELNNTLEVIRTKLEKYLLDKIQFPVNINNIHSSGFFNIFSRHGDSRTLVLNFNYTDTIKIYLRILGTNTRIINLHGQLNDSENPLIIGYGDNRDRFYREIQELDDKEYLRFMKHFSYNLNNNQSELIEFLNSGEFEVDIIGHSCGLSDRTILHRIVHHNNFKGLRLFYHETKENFRFLNENIDHHFEDPNRWADLVQPFDPKLKCPQFDLTPVLTTEKNQTDS